MAAAQEDIPILDIRLFGQAEIRVCGAPLRPLHSRRGIWLLALLALERGVPVERARLAGHLWPDSDDQAALHNLRQTLADLRRALGPAAQAVRSDSKRTLSLDLAIASVDVLAFDAFVGSDAEARRSAMALYRGSLIRDCDEPWAAEARAPREESYLRALEQLAEEDESEGRHQEAVVWLRRAASADPYRESVHRALMRSLAACGELAAACEVYRVLRQRLRSELNSEPDPETTAFFRQLRGRTTAVEPAKTAANPRRRARRLPVTRTPLIGRDDAARQVALLLEQNRLLTLVGAGGVGKTSLAVRIANEREGDYEDGVVFVQLASLADPQMVPESVRQETGLDCGEGRPDAGALIIDYFSARHSLLVLDNCEHLLTACAELADRLLTHCPDIHILATSRHVLGIGGEVVWRVPSLELPPMLAGSDRGRIDPRELASYAAVELFITRARAAESSFRLTQTSAQAVAEICRCLDGMPLAIELAAARVRSLSAEEINARLDQRFRLLTGGSRTALPRHRTLRALIDWSYDLLNDAERDLLRRLSVFLGGWTLESAQRVCSGGAVEEWEVLDLLTSLADKSLVLAELLGGTTRYCMLETVRQYSHDRLLDSGEAETWRDRHLAYFLRLAEEAAQHRGSAEQQERLEEEHDNTRAALEWSEAREQADVSLRLCAALWWFWNTRGYLREGREHLERALATPGAETCPALRITVLNAAGHLAEAQGDHADAEEHFQESLAITRELGDNAAAAWALNGLGQAACSRGDFPTARERFEGMLAIFRELGDKQGIASSLHNLGWVARYRRDSEVAQALLEEGLSIHVEVGDKYMVAWSLCGLGELAHEGRNWAAAGERFVEAIEIFTQIEDRIGIVSCLEWLGFVAEAWGQSYRAARLFGAAERLREDMGAPFPPADRAEHDRCCAAVRATIGERAFAAAWEEGRTLALEQAIELAMVAAGG